jgi:hypothetical protein
MVVEAAPPSLTIPRMLSDAAGECRFDRVEIPLTMKVYAPPAAPVTISSPMSVSNGIFMYAPPRFVGERHRSPRKQLIICLSGAVRIVGSGGVSHILSAGGSFGSSSFLAAFSSVSNASIS